MGLTRPPAMPPTVKQWLKTSFKSTSSSLSMRKLDDNDDGMDESFSASEEDTVSLYDDSFSGGAVSYNFSPIQDEHAADSASTGNDSRPQQLQQHQPPSLSAMLSELQSDVDPSSSIMTEIVLSLSNIDVGRDWSTPTVFATAVDSFDEASDSKMRLLSCEDEPDDSNMFSKADRNLNTNASEPGDENDAFAEWRSTAAYKSRPVRSPSRSSATARCRKCTKVGSMDPVYVYNARQEHSTEAERKNSVEYHLGKHENSAVSTRKEAHVNDDCTLSSAETALVSNRSSDNAKRDLKTKQHPRGCARASVVAKKKMHLGRKSRWMTAFRNPKHMTGSLALSAVSEEYYDG